MAKQRKILARSEVISLISKGNAIVIYEKYVLNLTSWISKHPGGDKAIHHMVGRDATDEMNAYHGNDTVKLFRRWNIGEIDYLWENLLPPIQGATYTSSGRYHEPPREMKLTDSSSDGSDVELNSSSSSVDSMTSQNKGVGFPKGKVVSKVPQNILVNMSNKDSIFPLKKDVVVDPGDIIEAYDNELSQKDLAKLPSLDYEVQQKLRDKYNDLHMTVIKNGFYDCDYMAYVKEIVKISSLFLYAFSFLKLNYIKLSATFVGIAWHQMTFIAHDAGHVSITHDYQKDNLFGMIVADWFGGLSLGWWKRNHNVHHLITNDPVHDPDIQHLPFFAVSSRLLKGVYSTYYENYLPLDAAARFLIPIQNYMYYPILCFGRFNLYRLSWMHLILGQGPREGRAAWFRYFELVGLSFFFWWFFYLLVYRSLDTKWDMFAYVMISHITTMLVHVQITLSHFAMSTSDLGVSESFPQRQIRTTMDVDCPQWLDFLHGGLQFQAIHHLFPRLPRHNLRRVQPFVIEFCKEVGLQYSIYGFGKGNEIVIDKLGDVAKQCSIMLEATKRLKDHDH